MIDFELKRSKRKTICLSVDKSGNVIVKAPIKMSVKEIETFVNKHQAWIDARLNAVRQVVLLSEEQKEELIRSAKQEIPVRVEYYSDIMQVNPCSVKITSAQTRWGSCSYKNGLCFSFRIMLLEQDLIDYIVVHELAHIRVKNHSKAFYEEVGVYMPDYKQRIKRLKAIQQNLLY